MTRYDRINALGIHFGQDFRFGFTCRYKDTVTVSTEIGVTELNVTSTDEISENLENICKLEQFETEHFEDKIQSAYLGSQIFFRSECDLGIKFDSSAKRNVFYYLQGLSQLSLK